MSEPQMELHQVKGNTWVIKSWLMIPLYKLDEDRCILLDSGITQERQALCGLLSRHGLRCVGIIGTHAHSDHMGNHAYFQAVHRATIAMPLGEAGMMASQTGVESSIYNLPPRQVERHVGGTTCIADLIIMPHDAQVSMHGVTFDVLHTPGHSIDHIAIRTPDNVSYLGDAIITGRTLYRSKFPYILSVERYYESLRLLRGLSSDWYIVSHEGVYPEIVSFVDMEVSFLQRRMQAMLELIEGETSVEGLTQRICKSFSLPPKTVGDMTYFIRATQGYVNYLVDSGHLEMVLSREGLVRYYRAEVQAPTSAPLPPTGFFAGA